VKERRDKEEGGREGQGRMEGGCTSVNIRKKRFNSE
jgi:hypothetical protein